MQVSSTAGISVGQWVRLWVQQPTQPAASRRLLLGQDEAAAAGGWRQLLQGRNGGSSGAPAGNQTYLPLSAAAAAARFSFASEALEAHGAVPGSGALPPHPVVASAGGTLDAYLYGENAVDSGSSQALPLVIARAAAYRLTLDSHQAGCRSCCGHPFWACCTMESSLPPFPPPSLQFPSRWNAPALHPGELD